MEILQHLALVVSAKCGGVGARHPNVLAYIDSWEEDDALFIRTELCEMGNFARFLWEYGRTLPRLDEARVWKIFAELSDVSTRLAITRPYSYTNTTCRVYDLYTKRG